MDFNMAVLKNVSLSRSSLDQVRRCAGVPFHLEKLNDFAQVQLRTYIMLASSFLALDTTLKEHPQDGIASWRLGWDRIVDLLTALHYRGELEYATVNAASSQSRPLTLMSRVEHPSIGALSECWSVSASYKGVEGGREGVREIATRLKKLLDEDGVRYKGQAVYVP